MAPMTSEPANARARRQAFVATCSPDELLGQVIQTLGPSYNIDAPHLLALRRVLSSAIVAPRKPPTLKRTRPDKRIGEIGSIYDTARRSPYGPNGPPVSANQSFYFHHKDADFERLLPAVDRSSYEWRDEPASQSESDGEEIPNSQESIQSDASTAAMPATKPKVSTLETASASPCPIEPTKKVATNSNPQAQELRPAGTSELVSSDDHLLSSKSSPQTPRKDASANSKEVQHLPVPTIIITTPRSTERKVTSEHENTALSPPLLVAANITIELPDTQDKHTVPHPPYTASSFYLPQFSDTQDTVNSTQQSEVFSPPDDFVHYTPPTQEETQEETSVQIENYSCTTISKAKAVASNQSSRRSLRTCSSGPPGPTPSQHKRSRGKSESTDEAPLLKRSKSKETT